MAGDQRKDGTKNAPRPRDKHAERAARRERLADALRANLKKRKQQVRSRPTRP